MSLGFLSVGTAGPIARSPMERLARAAGARFEERDGWSVAVDYPGVAPTTGWADGSHLTKIELQGSAEALGRLAPLELGRATRAGDAWWCPLTTTRALVIAEPAVEIRGSDDVSAVDVTSVFAAMTLLGPQAREIFARFCAIDLRDGATPVAGLRPGSIARQPGLIVRESEQRYLFLFGWAIGEYMWTTVADAGAHLGAGPVGVDALAPLPASLAEPEAARA